MGDGQGVLVFITLAFQPLPVCGLIPAWLWGPVGPGESRKRAAWGATIVLNLLATPILLGYMGYLMCPFVSFGIGATVGSVAGRRAWLYGTLASFWYIIPYQIHWVFKASPGQIQAYGLFPPTLAILTLPVGLLGGLAASGTLWLSPKGNRSSDMS